MVSRAAVLLRGTAAAAGAALGLFHVWLFVRHALDGGLSDPARVGRWLVAACVAAALVALHRRGVSLVRGRRAVALWMVAALLHGPAAARMLSASDTALPEIAAVVVQAATSAAAFVLLLIGFASWRRRSTPNRHPRSIDPLGPGALRWLAAGGAFPLAAPRPPPSA